MNIKKYIIALLLTFCFVLKADASKLPEDVWKYVKANLPDAKQRFDSVIILKNDVMYIPLSPPVNTEVDAIKADYTYPSKTSFKQLPEVVLLNNGFSFLKVFKDESGNYSLTKKDDLPIKVRLGLMPQDMLTPVGLKVPESLKLTLGDLLIPSKDETALTKLDDDAKSPFSPAVRRNEFIAGSEFNNKKIFINPKNSKFLEVYDTSSPNPLYELKLSGMPKKFLVSSSGDVALVMYWNNKELDIINLKDENVISKIQLNDIPTDMAYNKKDNLAYVSSSEGSSINIIDLNSMQLTKIIKLDQRPSDVTYCEFDDSISFYDKYLSKVFNITRNQDEYNVQALGEVKNPSKILSDVANVYVISRTEANIKVFDKNQERNNNATIEINRKPTDAIISDAKIYILCSKEGYLDVFDTVKNEIVESKKLPDGEFYSKITKIPDGNNILITGLSAKNHLIFDIENYKLVKNQESYINISNIIIMNKSQRL